jgi:hypothetical protein
MDRSATGAALGIRLHVSANGAMNVMTRRLPLKGQNTLMTTSHSQEQTKSTAAPATKEAPVAKQRARTAPPTAKPARKATRVKKAAPARRRSKTTKILDLLKRPGGVTLKELVKATGWQPHSVRGFLSGTIGTKMGTPVESSKRADGERVYGLSSQ